MAARGRPAKVLSPADLDKLKLFLQELPFLKKSQELVLKLLASNVAFDEKEMGLLKTADREKGQFQQRQVLIEQIKLKQKNQQKLLANEIEILAILDKEQDRDTFFRLDRALESYQKIEKAALENRIRLENEQKRELLQKTSKQLTEAQKKRNAEHQLKYALGGAVLAAIKKLGESTTEIDPKEIEDRLIESMSLTQKFMQTDLYQQAYAFTNRPAECSDLVLKVMDSMRRYKIKDESLFQAELKKHYKPR